MSEYNEYVTAVNKIFDYLSKRKAGWSSMDNKNYIESIEEYKQIVINNVNLFKEAQPQQAQPESLGSEEVKAND